MQCECRPGTSRLLVLRAAPATAEEGEATGWCWLGGVQNCRLQKRGGALRTQVEEEKQRRRRSSGSAPRARKNIARVTGGERVVASARAPHDGCTGAARTSSTATTATSPPHMVVTWGGPRAPHHQRTGTGARLRANMPRQKARCDVKEAAGGGRPRGGQAARGPSVRLRAPAAEKRLEFVVFPVRGRGAGEREPLVLKAGRGRRATSASASASASGRQPTESGVLWRTRGNDAGHVLGRALGYEIYFFFFWRFFPLFLMTVSGGDGFNKNKALFTSKIFCKI